MFALSTSGSEEYCGTVIHRALKELKWSGDEETGIQDYWRDAAERGKGKFFNIDADRTVKAIKTPFDPQLI